LIYIESYTGKKEFSVAKKSTFIEALRTLVFALLSFFRNKHIKAQQQGNEIDRINIYIILAVCGAHTYKEFMGN